MRAPAILGIPFYSDTVPEVTYGQYIKKNVSQTNIGKTP